MFCLYLAFLRFHAAKHKQIYTHLIYIWLSKAALKGSLCIFSWYLSNKLTSEINKELVKTL